MLVVIDANIFSAIVQSRYEFEPLTEYIITGEGKVAYGGSKYNSEISAHIRFSKFLVELKRGRRTVRLDTNDVDCNEQFLIANFQNSRFNDHHIMAIVVLSQSEIVCSLDQGLHALINRCYQPDAIMIISKGCKHPGRIRKPGIYQNRRHEVLFRKR